MTGKRRRTFDLEGCIEHIAVEKVILGREVGEHTTRSRLTAAKVYDITARRRIGEVIRCVPGCLRSVVGRRRLLDLQESRSHDVMYIIESLVIHQAVLGIEIKLLVRRIGTAVVPVIGQIGIARTDPGHTAYLIRKILFRTFAVGGKSYRTVIIQHRQYLVVELETETGRIRVESVYRFIDHSDRVVVAIIDKGLTEIFIRREIGIGTSRPVGRHEVRTFLRHLIDGHTTWIGGFFTVNFFRPVGITDIVGERELRSDIQFLGETVVHIETGRETLHVGTDRRTVFFQITQRETIGSLVATTRHRERIIDRVTNTRYFIEPVGIDIVFVEEQRLGIEVDLIAIQKIQICLSITARIT